MKLLLMIMFASCLAAGFCEAQRRTAPPGSQAATYELYSWQDLKGRWNFSLFYTTNRQKTVQEVFSKKSALQGVQELERKISKLPRHSNIVWFDRLTLSGKPLEGSEGLKYPSKETIAKVRRYAAKRHIEISGPEHE